MPLSLGARTGAVDLVCLSHLPWNFVYQRPNHLMARAAKSRRVFFVEEPARRGGDARVEAEARDGLTIVRPIVPDAASDSALASLVRAEIDRFLASEGVVRPWLWYYTPMALPWTEHIDATSVVYDCMDELSGFRFAPSAVRQLEQRLIDRADVVFTGGRSLFEAKRDRHPRTFLFPSSVDAAHFGKARSHTIEPPDQAAIARPRIGYFGVIDERIDLELIGAVARARPSWQLVMVGPLAKIDESELPRAANIHWLGLKQYEELPAYLAGWDVAIMPFALNESTRHISPTKTPEYLAGGRPVVSTPIHDVVHPYGEKGLVAIARDAGEFVASVEATLHADRGALLSRADRFLASQSWDATWRQMEQLVDELSVGRRERVPAVDRMGHVAAAVPAAMAGPMRSAEAMVGAGSAAIRARPR